MLRKLRMFLASLLLANAAFVTSDAASADTGILNIPMKGSETTSIAATSDGGILVAGYNETKTPYSVRAWIARFDDKGTLIWKKEFSPQVGNKSADLQLINIIREISTTTAVVAMSDGGGVVIGDAIIKIADPNLNTMTTWIARFDKQGTIQWQKTFGRSPVRKVHAAVPHANGDILILTENKAAYFSKPSFWLSRFNGKGETLWTHKYGEGLKAPHLASVDNRLLLIGSNLSKLNPEDLFNKAPRHYYTRVLCLNEFGDKLWEQDLKADSDNSGTSVTFMPEGGSLVAGTDLKANKTVRLFRLDSRGKILWRSTFLRKQIDNVAAVLSLTKETFALVGYRMNKQAQSRQGVIIGIDAKGKQLWEKTLSEKPLYYVINAVRLTGGNLAIAANISDTKVIYRSRKSKAHGLITIIEASALPH